MALRTQKSSQATNEIRKTVRIPLVGNSFNRTGTTSKDQKFINCYPETTKNVVTELKKLFLVKRPGTTLHSTVVGAGATCRGAWSFNGHIYSVYGSKVYEDTTELHTLATSTGQCGGVLCLAPKEALFICDGIDGYIINSSGNIENVERAMSKWQASYQLEIGDKYIPTTSNGYYYTVSANTGEEKTGTSEPTWPTTIGNTVVDGDITWTCTAAYTGAEKWVTATAYSVGDYVTPTTENALYYKITEAGTSGASEPTWPVVIGDEVTADGVTYECVGYYGGFPSPHTPTPVYLDGYVFLPEANSVDFYNSGIANPFSWNAIDFAAAENFSDPIVALARQNNYVVAFGNTSTELFYDAANDTGSPLLRREDFLLSAGTQSPYAIFQAERFLIWIGNSDAGFGSVWMMDNLSTKEISTEYIERTIQAETDIANIKGFGIRIDGHIFFVLNLPTVNKTLVYDIEEQMWHEWSYNNGNVFPFNYHVVLDNTHVVCHNTNGKQYEISSSEYQDFGTDITLTVVTSKQDFESNRRKFIWRTEVIGDLYDTDVYLSNSDDDYTTWSTEQTLNTSTRAYTKRGGASRRRAWKIKHMDNTPLRLEFLEVVYTEGAS